MRCNIIQHGSDGIGHQLYGLFTTLILHNIQNYNFCANIFINKRFRFDHVSQKEGEDLKNYMIETINNFIKENNIKENNIKENNTKETIIKNCIHTHELNKIPKTYNINTVYSIDNAYYFERINLNNEEKKNHKNNIEKFKNYFINNKFLPKNRLEEKSIVIHIRLGDAMNYNNWANEINDNNNKIKEVLCILKKKYPTYKLYIHSNGNPDIFNDFEYTFFDKNTPVLQFLSDVINSDIFICAPSALSKISTFFSKAKTIIIPDDTKQSVSENCIKISNYINLNK